MRSVDLPFPTSFFLAPISDFLLSRERGGRRRESIKMSSEEARAMDGESKTSVTHDEKLGDSSLNLKLDPHGFPLRPQPTDDPLGASFTLRHVYREPH